MKYVLTEVISVVEPNYDADGEFEYPGLTTHYNRTTREVILHGRTECTHRSNMKDMLHGDIQLCPDGSLGCHGWQKGATMTATDSLLNDYDNDHIRGNCTYVLTVLEFGEFDPTK